MIRDLPRRNPPPAHCPYQVGDWVRVHGRHGNPDRARQRGWRGYVTGYIGGTILVGVTDDGRGWAEEWGTLGPDAPTPRGVFDVCTCCPRVVENGQQSLFGAVSVLRNGDVWWWRRIYGLDPATGSKP
jgi:hypothetical protein